MSRNIIVIIILLLLVFFSLASQAILRVKLKELKMELTKSQIMNYEFSSQSLRKKFKQMLVENANIQDELLNSNLDSYVMNYKISSNDDSLNEFELFGLGIVNSIRKMSFKPLLSLKENQKNAVKLQYAFLLERNQKFREANKEYDSLEKDLSDSPGNDYSFLLLHNAYCLAIIGKRTEALSKLEQIIQTQPGSHFSESATIFIEILTDLDRKIEVFEKKELSQDELIRISFSSGLFLKTIELLKLKDNLSYSEKYMLGRSYEKTGDVLIATDIYKELVKQKEDLVTAKKANRRLLVIGMAYDGGKEISKLAKEKAVQLKDTVIVQKINDNLKLQKENLILENIKIVKNLEKEESSEITFLDDKILEIEKEINRDIPIVEEEKENTIVKEERRKQLLIKLNDGRSYKGYSLIKNGRSIVLNNGKFDIILPLSLIKVINIDPINNLNTNSNFMEVVFVNNQSINATAIQSGQDSLIAKVFGKNTNKEIKEFISIRIK